MCYEDLLNEIQSCSNRKELHVFIGHFMDSRSELTNMETEALCHTLALIQTTNRLI